MSIPTSDPRAELLSVRPSIASIETGLESNPAEQFQNQTLRPILKFQSNLLVAIFHQYIHSRKGAFHQLKAAQKPAYISDSLRKDQSLLNFMLGTLVGQFTLEEYQVYIAHEKDIRKRTLAMLTERLIDQVLND